MITIGTPPRRYRLIRVGQLVFVAAVVVQLLACFVPVAALDTIAWPLRNGFSLAAGAFCVLRATLIRGERAPWAILGVGLLAYGTSTITFNLLRPVTPDGQQAISGSYCDIGWLAFYPACYAAVILLLRRRVLRLPHSVLLDVVVSAFGMAAVTTGVGVLLIRDSSALGPRDTMLMLAYPVADLFLLLLVVSVFALLGRHPGRVWWLLALGMIFFVVADSAYLVNAVQIGWFSPGGFDDVFWALSPLMLALAAWEREPRTRPARASGWAVLVVPTVLALAALGVLVAGATVRLNLASVVLSAATLIAALVRAAFTFAEVRRLAETKELASTDELTGLPNRRGLTERLRAAIENSPAGQRVALLVLDLDKFKLVNDTLGHRLGDEILTQAGRRIATALRPGDVLARLGGDEFAVLLERTDADGSRLVADRVRTALADPLDVGVLTYTATASIGMAVYPSHAANADELLARADIAMYAAKNRHTGVENYDPGHPDNPLFEFGLVEDLRAGISGDEIELHVQPKLNIATGQVRSAEALARWRHPDRGLLTPASFVPLAEHAGLMGALTMKVLEQSCAQLARWRADGMEVTLAVNISATDLLDQAFPDQVRGVLAAHGLCPEAIELELTETTVMLDRSRSAAVLSQLHEAGIGISIDDYGTGYSTLDYLGGDFPVDVIKLDQSFVRRLDSNTVAQKIVRHTVDLAHDLGLRVVAEGVESAATLALLEAFGCDFAQGYHVSPPVPADRFAELVERTPAGGAAVPSQPRGR
ncbi:EAL domain-containing protein [Frankia sp. CNm7]|uniref:EAL domain-containing protein n=1 Tax=Frankia nepalensis TaxID=1836974 RepID=A0A937UTF5_9ACTN|nr:EAL domain-containing protein [Frankia nepalensis]MBL7497305.1 EAL domain-containing protein [Frankia nepalensis]MBL7515669.1 EAL domain-containing protein [Frankia nepalensis]MBL7523417.1 EAL domain-containing protein [Frankia nepalensis]MBL7631215.1 EAL domain-containing protein [Frankia nepalensis]